MFVDDFIVSVMIKNKALREYQKEFGDAENEGEEDDDENSVVCCLPTMKTCFERLFSLGNCLNWVIWRQKKS